MKEYSVVPNRDVTGWYVKIEDVAPTDYHSTRDEAVMEAESMAKDNAPSKVIIYDAHQEIEEQRQF
ncbi:DUF2188 domain-containing protein [Terribacillus sp. DMT04]|uniref:DUF2188 domain-containing protein n=1 Tax=Terribacillus sp. DMT04 TaxID=2850441 RepID=UPI001C2C6F5E|nr:DUF2188 domain-containing protein [Terribacillus sp. DMT04]QXE01224.1 DUF2188 domain-containing protein [Terribacillus sp. DMT04]